MNIGFVVVMRMTSKRLPNKPFSRLGNNYVVDRVIENVLHYVDRHNIVFAISDKPTDDALENHLKFHNINVFRGPENNVLKRFIGACNTLDAEWYIRYNGDNIFHCPANYEQFVNAVTNSDVKIITNTQNRSLPNGISFEAVEADFLNGLDISNLDEYEKEHIFPAIYSAANKTQIFNIHHDVNKYEINFSLDSVKDSLFFINRESDRYIINAKDEELLSIYNEKISFDNETPFIGESGVFTIAEIGGNHEGDFEYAKDLVRQATFTDVDSIKLQIYTPDLIVNPIEDAERNKHFSKFALQRDENIELLKIIRSAGKKTMASVWSLEELSYYEPYLDYVKVGSGDFTDKTILKEIVKLNKPLVISAGLSEEKDVKDIISYLISEGLGHNLICLLQCTSMYPIPPSEANLNVIERFKEIMPKITIGYSDHTVGNNALLKSVSMGAQVLEFHYTDNKKERNFRDHLVSLEDDDITTLINWIREDYVLGGNSIKRLTPSEISSKHDKSFRKALYPKKNLPKDHIIKAEDIIALRPEHGWPSHKLDELLGRKLKQAKNKYAPIYIDDLY